MRLIAEYLRFRYTGAIVRFYTHLRGLPSQESRLSWVALALAALLIVATPFLATLGPRFATVTFEDVQGTMQSIPAAALVLAYAAFAVTWGYVLAGAVQGPGLIWILAALAYVYLVVQIGFTVGRSYWHLVIITLPVVIGATIADGRLWAKLTMLAGLASLTLRITPLPPPVRARWWIWWIPATLLLFGMHQLLARRPWKAAGTRVWVISLVTGFYLLAIAAVAGQHSQMAEGLNVALNSALGPLEALWFVLGASFVMGAIALGRLGTRMVEIAVTQRRFRWFLLAAWTGLAAWALYASEQATSGRPWTLVAMTASLGVLGVRWWQTGMTTQWLSGWFVSSIAAVIVITAFLTRDVPALLTREAGALSIAAFTGAVVWETGQRIPRLPAASAGFSRPAPLLIYLGTVLLIATASLFGLSANLRFFQQVVVLQEYKGAASLWIPLALFTAVSARPGVPAQVRHRLVQGFLLGAVAAVPAFLIRAAGTPDIAYPATLLISSAVAFLLVRSWPDVHAPLPAAAVGIAAALGFAISLWQRVLVDLLPPLLTMIAALSGIQPIRQWAIMIFEWSRVAGWSPRDQLIYYGLSPALAVLAALIVVMRRRGQG